MGQKKSVKKKRNEKKKIEKRLIGFKVEGLPVWGNRKREKDEELGQGLFGKMKIAKIANFFFGFFSIFLFLK